MKLKRLAALVLAVMMTLAAASATGLSKLAAEGTQKPEKSVVDAAGATWYHADAGEELRFDDDSSYCFESESFDKDEILSEDINNFNNEEFDPGSG